jgi:hypothetical protein
MGEGHLIAQALRGVGWKALGRGDQREKHVCRDRQHPRAPVTAPPRTAPPRHRASASLLLASRTARSSGGAGGMLISARSSGIHFLNAGPFDFRTRLRF